jgi:hypothetical protein
MCLTLTLTKIRLSNSLSAKPTRYAFMANSQSSSQARINAAHQKFVDQYHAFRLRASRNPMVSAPDEYVSSFSTAGQALENPADVERLANLRYKNTLALSDLTDVSKRFGGGVPAATAPQPLAPKTLDDFKAAHAAALANRQNSSGKSNSSRLSQDQLMANAAAYNARKQAEAAARFDRRMMGQQVRNYKNMAGLGYNDPVFVQPGVSPETMLEADMNRQRMGMQQQYMDRDFGLRERSLGQTANEAREAARLARLQLAAEAANRNRQFNLDQKRLGIEQSSADSEADYRNKQVEAVAAQFGFDKEKYRDAKNKVDQDASMPSLPPALAILVKSGRMTQQQAVDVIENEMIRAEVGNDKKAVVNILQERGYSPQEIARKFEAITRINKEMYDANSSTWWDRWWLPSIPEPNPSNFPLGYVQP